MSDSDAVLTITADNFKDEVLGSKKPVLVDVWAEWCGPCRQLAPTISALATDYEGRAVVAKLDAQEQQALSSELGIKHLPTLIFFKDGAEVDRASGVRSKEELGNALETLLAS